MVEGGAESALRGATRRTALGERRVGARVATTSARTTPSASKAMRRSTGRDSSDPRMRWPERSRTEVKEWRSQMRSMYEVSWMRWASRRSWARAAASPAVRGMDCCGRAGRAGVCVRGRVDGGRGVGVIWRFGRCRDGREAGVLMLMSTHQR